MECSFLFLFLLVFAQATADFTSPPWSFPRLEEVSLPCVVLILISLSQKRTEPEAGSEPPASEFIGFALMKNLQKTGPAESNSAVQRLDGWKCQSCRCCWCEWEVDKKEGAIVHAVACIACGCGERAYGMEFLLFLCLAVGKVKTK